MSLALLAKSGRFLYVLTTFVLEARMWLLLVFVWTTITFVSPVTTAVLLGINLLVIVILALAQLWAALLPRFYSYPELLKQSQLPKQSSSNAPTPLVSIHIPICNEPPHLVLETLEHLSNLSYSNFEVIVLDNNTHDKSLWRPVQARCQALGKQFKFYHVANLAGFKAGALNLCLSKTDPNAAFVMVIDADYCVAPNLLEVALSHFGAADIALVQFPQAYSNAGSSNAGLAGEYRHFFDVYMNMANHLNCVLATGTVSVIRRSALAHIGGWQGRSITEDVELGLHLLASGYKGRFVNTSLGYGLMPTEMCELHKQRRRWVFGNAQTLRTLWQLRRPQLGFKQRLGVLIQLTAWFNLNYFPVLTLVVLCLVLAIAPQHINYGLFWLSLASLWLQWLIKLSVFALTRQRACYSSFLTHLALAKQGAQSWLNCYLGRSLGFERTSKFAAQQHNHTWLNNSWSIAAALASASLLYVHQQRFLAVAVFITFCAPLSKLWLSQQLTATQHITATIHQHLVHKWKGYLYE